MTQFGNIRSTTFVPTIPAGTAAGKRVRVASNQQDFEYVDEEAPRHLKLTRGTEYNYAAETFPDLPFTTVRYDLPTPSAGQEQWSAGEPGIITCRQSGLYALNAHIALASTRPNSANSKASCAMYVTRKTGAQNIAVGYWQWDLGETYAEFEAVGQDRFAAGERLAVNFSSPQNALIVDLKFMWFRAAP